jgi:hypothetical protein
MYKVISVLFISIKNFAIKKIKDQKITNKIKYSHRNRKFGTHDY